MDGIHASDAHAEARAYRKLAALLREQIRCRALRPGMPAPSITVLSQEHHHARQTCAKALRVLEGEGLVQRVPGLGYYVSPHSRVPGSA